MQKKLLLLIVLLLSSCSYFVSIFDEDSFDIVNVKSEKLSIVFSHNINGETHPCGCRHFPLGGLPQVAGKIEQIKKTGEVLYVDIGDTFFPSSTIPTSVKTSLTFAAENLARGLDQMGLKYLVPGDQDFATGVEFLRKMAEERNFHFLISNLSDPQTIKHREWVKIERGPHKIFLMGFVSPAIVLENDSHLFLNLDSTFKRILPQLQSNGYKQNDPFHRLIVLSHAGMDDDKAMVKKYPFITWVIGSHSQSFTKDPVKEGKTRLVQTLSRNHHLGEIQINLSASKDKDSFELHEMREELAKELTPNPFFAFIDEHKKKLTELQDKEQSSFDPELAGKKFVTANSCLECHEAQSNHWEKTAHSVAYLTLIRAKEEKNMACIKCHSLGANDPRGFSRAIDMIEFNDKKHPSLSSLSGLEKKQKKDDLKRQYWEAIKKEYNEVGSVRKLSGAKRQVLSRQWQEFDKRHHVSHNFANVQCLNCHDKHPDHPFTTKEAILEDKEKFESMKNKCLICHTGDQSPQWYDKDHKGLAGKVNDLKVLEAMKKVGCPKDR